ncbi:hypothetical protein [Nitrosomonas eutropha]|uniref:Uncharacterized protein n=2 Tax=Nitrosomonas eutropha TaxID=916 RepID=A0ABX5M370_9PROT|nr:hypothetical protein [Nitrosomonas eutropha]ABI60081.1 hypothetical protein Neut_1849 [Nitrosomonas eutropha C91]PXV73197.1 hypothetical protein C8R14_1591 [Nitrosomonas eutropha]
MTNPEDLQRDTEAALGDVERLRTELLEFSELVSINPVLRDLRISLADDLEEFRDRVAQLLDRISQLLKEIGYSAYGRSNEGSAFSLATLANELNAQLEWLKGVLEHIENMIQDDTQTTAQWFINQVTNPVRAALNKIKTILTPLLKRFLSKIWQIISNLLRCLVPRCAGVTYNQLRRDDLWDRYYTEAPARQWRCVERYKIVKRV